MTYRNEDVIKMVAGFSSVHVDAEKDSLTAQKYGVAGYPTIVLARADGTEIDRIYGYADPEEFMKIINEYLAGKNTLDDYLTRSQAAPTMELYYLIANKYVARKKFDEAGDYLGRIISGDPRNTEGYSDSAMFSLGDMKSRAKEYEAAMKIFSEFGSVFPESDMADDAYFALAKTLRRQDKFDEAIAEFKKFPTVFPESDMLEDAEIYVAFCNVKKGDNETALNLYKKFLTDHPESSEIGWINEQIDKIVNPPTEEKEG